MGAASPQAASTPLSVRLRAQLGPNKAGPAPSTQRGGARALRASSAQAQSDGVDQAATAEGPRGVRRAMGERVPRDAVGAAGGGRGGGAGARRTERARTADAMRRARARARGGGDAAHCGGDGARGARARSRRRRGIRPWRWPLSGTLSMQLGQSSRRASATLRRAKAGRSERGRGERPPYAWCRRFSPLPRDTRTRPARATTVHPTGAPRGRAAVSRRVYELTN